MSNAVYKKESYNSTSLKGKTTMSDDFELEEKVRRILHQAWLFAKSGTRIAEQASICVYKAYTFIIFF